MNFYPFNLYICSAMLILSLSACKQDLAPIEHKPVLRPVRTLTVEAAQSTTTLTFTAVVDVKQKADLSFKLAGSLHRLLVKQGDKVYKGDVIAKLDDTDLKLNLITAQANFDKASADYKRAKNLIKTKFISQADFDQLNANASATKAQLQTAKNNLSYSEITASFDGMIAKVYTDIYQQLNAMQPVVHLHDLNTVMLKVNVPESIMLHLKKGAVKGEVTASFSGIEKKVFPITFAEVATIADENSKTYEVLFSMPTPDDFVILPGMTAKVTAKVSSTNTSNQGENVAFYLPSNTVLSDRTNHYVFVVNGLEGNVGKVSKKIINIGNITSQGIEVFSGLTKGDLVVNAGVSKITDGLLVKF